MPTDQVIQIPSTFQTFVDLIGHLVWPITVVIIVLFFRKAIIAVLKSLKSFSWKDFALEVEESQAPASSPVELLKSIIQDSPHSFEWIRSATQLDFTDAEFQALIKNNPNVFEETRIIKRDAEGTRVIPGKPGVRLKS